MPALQESPYRALRRAFIAAGAARGVDAIARVHPGRAPDGKPLFTDSAALGDRLAQAALLVLSDDAQGSALLTGLLETGVAPPPGARLVLVHALDPAHFVGLPGDAAWPKVLLAAVAAEDLSRVTCLSVMDLTARGFDAALLPEASIVRARERADAAARIDALLAAFQAE